nr:MAG TPA: RNA polymerase [Caudoviricetes sp.]
MTYNPYLRAAQGQYPAAEGQLNLQTTTPDIYQQAQQAVEENVYQSYTNPMNQRVEATDAYNQVNGMTVPERIIQNQAIRNRPLEATAQERSTARALDASQKMKARLGDEQAQQAQLEDARRITQGEDPNKVREERAALNKFQTEATDAERIANHQLLVNNPSMAHKDLELERDILNSPVEVVQAKYQDHPELLNYIMQQKQQYNQSVVDSSVSNRESDDTAFSLGNFGSAMVAGIGENIGGVVDAFNMATKSGADRVDALNNGLSKSIQDYADDMQTSGGKASDARAQADAQREDRVARQAYLQAKEVNDTDTEAENKAEWAKTKEATKNLLDNPYQITKEAVQFAPDIATDLIAGGLIMKGAKATGKKVMEKSAEKFEKEMAQQIREEATEKAMAKGLKSTEAKDFVEKAVADSKKDFLAETQKQVNKQIEHQTRIGTGVFGSANNALQNAPQGYQTASQAIMDAPLETLKQTQGFKDLKEANPELSDKEIQTKLADKAGTKGYAAAGAVSALAGVLGSQVEANMLLGKTKGITKKLAAAGVNAGEEATTEGGSVVAGNIAANKESGEKLVGTFKDAGKSAVMGALAAGTTTAITSVPMGLKSGIEKGLSKVTARQEKKLNERSNEAVTTALGSEDGESKSFTGKKFSETNFGKAYNTVADALKNDDNYSKFFSDSTDYTGSLKQLNAHRMALLQESEKAAALGDEKKATELQKQAKSIGQTLNELHLALNNDLLQNVDSFRDKMQEINEAQANNASATTMDKLWDDYESLLDTEEKVSGLRESTLYQILDGTTRDTVTSDSKITAADILGSGQFSMSPTQAFNKAVKDNTKLIDSIRKTTDPEEARKQTLQIASNIASFSASLASNMPKNINEANTVKGQVRTILDQLDQLTTTTKSKDLATIVDNFKRLVDKPIPSGTNIKAYTETMFGGTNAGMMDYLTRALANGGKLTEVDYMKLTKFMASQAGKIAGVAQAIEQLKKDPSKPVTVTNRALRPKDDDYVMKNQAGEDVTLSHVNKAQRYLDRVKAEANFFTALGNSILGLDLQNGAKTDSTNQTEQPEQPKGHHTVEQVFSGGAYGADSIWSRIAAKHGVADNNITHYVTKRNKANSKGTYVQYQGKALLDAVSNAVQAQKLSDSFKQQVRALYKDAKANPQNQGKALQLRNALQVVDADGVFAVNGINKGMLIRSGTNTAIRLGLAKGIPVYVLDPTTAQWHTLQNGKWKPTSRPQLTSKPALVGTRSLESYKAPDKNDKTKFVDTVVHPNADATIAEMEALFAQEKGAVNEQPQQSNNETNTGDTVDISWADGKNKDLSNLAPRAFEMKDRNGSTVRPYRSVEHYYQTWKSGFFDKNAYRSTALKPKGTKPVNPKISEQVMKEGMLASFKANPKALEKLLATGDKTLTHTMDKGHWGEAFPRLLMEVRSELKDFKPEVQTEVQETPDTTEENNNLDNSTYQFADKSMQLTERMAVSQPYIADKVAMAFDEIRDQWAKNLGNELTEFDSPETDTVLTLNTSKGEVEYRIPMSAMVEMNRKGYDPTVNLLDAITDKKEIQSKQVADDFMFNPTKDSLGKDNPIGEALVPIAKNIRAYFRKPISIFNPNYSSKLGKFHLTNGLLNLVSMEEQGGVVKAVVPAEVQLAFTKAQALAMANYRDLAFGKDSQYEDYWHTDLGAEGDPLIYESTNAEMLGSTHSSVNKDPVTLDHYSDLGITRNDFIEMLGDKVIEQLGLTINKGSKEYSEDIAKGLQYSLGLELYNAMMNQGLLTAHNVELSIKDNGQETKKTIPYVNFKLNLEDKESESNNALESFISNIDLDGMSQEQATAYLNKHPMLKATALVAKNLTNEHAESVFGTTDNENTGVRISSLSGRIGTKAKVQGKVAKSTTRNDITNTDNPELDSAIAHMNNVSYALNASLFNLLQNNPEALQLAFGYEADVDNMPVSEATKKAIRSKNNGITRAIGLLNKFVNQAKEQGLSEDDMMFQFNHHFVPNMRTMLKADMNPQSNKIIREMLRLVQSDINEQDGTITGEMKLDVDISGRSKFGNKGEPRTMASLIDVAKGRLKTKSRNFAVGFLLALNQGLDIGKIEKTKSDKIFTDVQEALDDPESMLYRMTDLVWAMQQAGEQNQEYLLTDEDKALLKEFGSELGNGAPRAMNAIQSWANFKYRGTNKDKLAKKTGRTKFSTSLLLEADGIGNGLHNITRQFAVKFSKAYFDTLKRTGMVTMDVLSQISVKRLSKKAQEQLRDEFEGSAGMFTPTQNNNGEDEQLRDIYEVIADKLSITANNAMGALKDFAAKNKIDLNNLTFRDFNNQLRSKNFKQKLPADIKNSLQFIAQLHMTGMVTGADNKPITDLMYEPFKNIALPKDYLINIKRNLAKAGVTPTVYGGQLEGIASQLFGDTKGNLIKKADKIIGLALEADKAESKADKEALLDQIKPMLTELEDSFKTLGIEFSNQLPEGTNEESEFEMTKAILDKNISRLNSNKRQFINALKDGLANELRNAVQDSYIDEFAMLNFAMAQDDIAFANFTEEFKDKVEQASKARNEKRKYAINDPRNHSPLSRKEIRDVISTITSAPVIATAFNADSVLFEDVFNMGNSLVKHGSYDVDERSTVNSNIANTRGGWAHNVTTQLMRSYRRYVAAGAANATGTIPSTESKTQATLAERLMETLSGITSLNVFDGIDGLLYFRDLLGQIANEQTNKVHLETSILNNFYDKFTKSGIADVLENTQQLSKGFRTYLSAGNLDFQAIAGYAYSNKLSRADAKYIMAVSALVQMQLENSKVELTDKLDNASLNAQSKTLNTFKSKLAEAFTDAVYNDSDELTLGKEPSNPEYPSFAGMSFIGEDVKASRNTLDRMYGVYNNVLKTYIHRVASTRALKHIEATELPVIINQFAGGNRGFFANPEKLSSTGKRFKDYVINNFGSDAFANFNFLTDSSMLADFLAQDEKIQKEYNKKYEAVKSKLHKPYITKGTQALKANSKDTVYSVNDMQKAFEDYMNVDTPVTRVVKAVSTLLQDTPVVTHLNEAVAKQLIPEGKKLEGAKDRAESIKMLVDADNLYREGSGVHVALTMVDEKPTKDSVPSVLQFMYLNTDSTTKGDMMTVFAHEGVHAVVNNLVNYSIAPDFQNQIEQDNPELAAKLKDFQGRLFANIEKFVSKNQNLEAVQDKLNGLRTDVDKRHHYSTIHEGMTDGLSNKVANVANFIYFFQELNESNLPEGFTPDMLVAARAGTLHEMLAYSLTDSDTARELSVHKEASWLSNIAEAVKDLYKSIRSGLRSLFGIQEDSTPEDVSMMDAMLESVTAFNQYSKPYTTELNFVGVQASRNQAYNALSDVNRTARINRALEEANQESMPQFSMNTTSIRPIGKTNLLFREGAKKAVTKLRESRNGELQYFDQAMTLVDTKINKQVSDVIAKLRGKGYRISLDEENDIVLAYKLNTIGNTTKEDIAKYVSRAVQEQLPNVPDNIITAVNKSPLDTGSLMLALMTLSSSVKGSLSSPAKTKGQTKTKAKLESLSEKVGDMFDFTGLTAEEKHLPSLERLQVALTHYNKLSIQSAEMQKMIVDSEIQKAQDLIPIQETLNKLSDELPQPLATVLAASSDLLTGKDYLPSGAGQDSMIGQLVRTAIRNHEELHGRNTALSKIGSWIVGQDSATQYSAKLKGEASQLNAIIRERLSTIIPESIRQQFKDLNDSHEVALDKVLMPSQLNRLGSLTTNVADLLDSSTARDIEIAQAEANIANELDKLGYTGKQKIQIENFIRWQTRGLGDWVVNREAKVQHGKYESNILPNAKVISSLIPISGVATKTTAEQNTKALRKYVEQLVTLHSLNHHDQQDLDTLAELYRNETKAFRAMMDSMDTVENELEIYGEDSYAGFDGHVMNKRNPYKDIKIINKGVKGWQDDVNHIQSLGYELKETLPNGDEVWFTNENPSNRFTTGVFNMTEHSIRGMDVKSYTPLHSFDSVVEADSVDLSNHPALKDAKYYDKLEEKTSRRTIIDNSGLIVGYSTALPKSLEDDLVETYENGIDAIGNVKGRITEELATEVNNKTYVDMLLAEYDKKKQLGQGNRFILIDGKYKPKGNSQADIEFANRVNSIYRSLPASTRKHIELKGGLYIERTEVDNLLGYSQASWTDVFTGKSGLPEPVQKMIRSTIGTLVKLYGGNPVKFMKRTERMVGEVASLSKDFILTRSGVVALGNMVSNLIHLWNTGVPLTEIPTLMRDGFINVRKYNKDYNRTLELRHLISITDNAKEKAKYELEMKMLEKALENNPVLPLVNEGILTNISSASGVDENDPYGLINTAQRKLGFNRFKQTKFGKAWGNIMIQEGSTTHAFMNATLDYGDFVAKYALYKHLTKNRQFNSDRALNVIRDEFINYGLNRGRMFDWTNKVGLTWFLSYKLGIQKIFLRNLRRNFLRSAAVYSGAKVLGTNQVVPAQNLLFDGSLRYQTDPSNLWEGFKTHWIGQVFG